MAKGFKLRKQKDTNSRGPFIIVQVPKKIKTSWQSRAKLDGVTLRFFVIKHIQRSLALKKGINPLHAL